MDLTQIINLIESGEIETGLEQLKQLAKTSSHDDKFNIALYYQQLGLVDEATNLMEELFELYPDEAQILLVLGELYMEQDRETEAIHMLNDIAPESELYVSALIVLADLYQMQGLDEVAEQKLLEAKQLLPEETIIDFGLGEFYFSQENYRKSAVYYERVLAEYENLSNVDIRLRMAESLSGYGEWEAAIPYFEAGLQEKKEIYSMFQFANTLVQAKLPRRAIQVLHELKEMNVEMTGLHQLLAQSYEAEGLLPEAIKTLEEGIQAEPYNVDLLMALAKMQIKQGDTLAAVKTLEEALAFEPNFTEAIHRLTELYFQEEKYEEVIALLEDSIKQGEHDPQFQWDLATAKKEEEQFAEALNHYEEAYTVLKTNSAFLEEYGMFLLEEGKREQAVEILRAALTQDETALHLVELLASLKE